MEDNLNYTRIAGSLQQRIAEQASRYEGELAILREQATQQIEVLTQERDTLVSKVTELESQLDSVKTTAKK